MTILKYLLKFLKISIKIILSFFIYYSETGQSEKYFAAHPLGEYPAGSPPITQMEGDWMKVSIEGILNSARRMKGQNFIDEESLHKKKGKIEKDSIEISSKINSRLLSIQKELSDIQSSMTRSQIIKEGISLLISDLDKGGERQDLILNELKFGNEKVLRAFVGINPEKDELILKSDSINKNIEKDVSSLKKLQIEVENILASNLAGSTSESVIRDIQTIVSKTDSVGLSNIHDLKPEMVMNLIN